MAGLYRKSALERMSSPEQLDVPLKVSTSMNWLVLAALAFLSVFGVIWSATCTLPQTADVEGIVVSSRIGIYSVCAGTPGTVQEIYRDIDDKVYKGDRIMKILGSDGSVHEVRADQMGYVTEIVKTVGEQVTENSAVLRLRPETGGADRVVVCYMPVDSKVSITPGKTANVSLYQYDSQSYGYMTARVINVDTRPTDAASQSRVIGKDNNMASYFASSEKGSMIAVTCELLPDTKTENGFYWSTEKGSHVKSVDLNSTCRVLLNGEGITPLEWVKEQILKLWGD